MKKIFRFFKKKKEPLSGAGDAATAAAVTSASTSSSSAASPSPPLTIAGYEVQSKELSKLHRAAATGNLKKLQRLSKKHDLNQQDEANRTPLHFACANGQTDVVTFLVDKRCKLNICDNDNRTPLMKAVQCQQECAVYLLDNGADCNLVDVNGNTALHLAASTSNISIAQELLITLADIEAHNKDGSTPLILAVTENKKEMTEFLLAKGANVNARDNAGRTPLLTAVSCGNHDLVNLLLSHGADISHKDDSGRSAEDYARIRRDPTLRQKLSEYANLRHKESSPGNKKDLSVFGSPRDAGFTCGAHATNKEVVDDHSSGESLRSSGKPDDDSWLSSEEEELDLSHKKVQKVQLSSAQLMNISQLFKENIPSDLDSTNVSNKNMPSNNVLVIEEHGSLLPLAKSDATSKISETIPMEAKELSDAQPVTASTGKSDGSQPKSTQANAEHGNSASHLLNGTETKEKRESDLMEELGLDDADDIEDTSDWDSTSVSDKSMPSGNVSVLEDHGSLQPLAKSDATGKISETSPMEAKDLSDAQPVTASTGKSDGSQPKSTQTNAEHGNSASHLLNGTETKEKRESDIMEELGLDDADDIEDLSDWDSTSVSDKSMPSDNVSVMEDHASLLPLAKSDATGKISESIPMEAEELSDAQPVTASTGKSDGSQPKSTQANAEHGNSASHLLNGTETKEKRESDVMEELGLDDADDIEVPSDLDSPNVSNKSMPSHNVLVMEDHASLLPLAKSDATSKISESIPMEAKELSDAQPVTASTGKSDGSQPKSTQANAEHGNSASHLLKGTETEEMRESDLMEELGLDDADDIEDTSVWDSTSFSLRSMPCCNVLVMEDHASLLELAKSDVIGKISETIPMGAEELSDAQPVTASTGPQCNEQVIQKVESGENETDEEKRKQNWEKLEAARKGEDADTEKELIVIPVEKTMEQTLTVNEKQDIKSEGEMVEDGQVNITSLVERKELILVPFNGFILKQEEEKRMRVEMLYEKSQEQLRKKEEQCSKQMEEKQQLELMLRTLEMEVRTLKARLKEVEEERNDMQLQLSQEQNARALQESILNSYLWRQKELEEESKRQLSKSSEVGDQDKELLQKNKILQDELREKNLLLESFQRDLCQLQSRVKELENARQVEKHQIKKYAVKQDSMQEQLVQLQNENLLLRQQFEDFQNKGIINEKVVTDIQDRFNDLFSKLRSDTEKQLEMMEERNKEVITKCNDLRKQVFTYETEKVEREGALRQLQKELADSLEKQSMSEALLEVSTCHWNNLEADRQQLQMEIGRIRYKVDELSHQLEIESERRTRLESVHCDLQEQLSSVKLLHKNYEKLENSKPQLEEEVANPKQHLQSNLMDHNETHQYKRDIEERGRQETTQKLEEVNLFSKAQAASRETLEQVRATRNTSRNQLEQRVKDLELARLKSNKQENTFQKESMHTELERYKGLYTEEQTLRQSLGNKLDRATEKLEETKAKLLHERQKSTSFLANNFVTGSLSSTPVLETVQLGNFETRLAINRTLNLGRGFVNSNRTTFSSTESVEAYLIRVQMELERNITKELEQEP